EKTGVNFTVSVNASAGITSGVSAFDRAKTIRILADPKSRPADLTRPGHVFGLVARPGGVLVREGHTEAAVDLAKLAGFQPAGVLCEIVGAGGKMAKLDELVRLARKLTVRIVAIDDLVGYLRLHPLAETAVAGAVTRLATTSLPTIYGPFQLTVYRSNHDGVEHTVLVKGEPRSPVITRIHSQCLTGDTLLSLRCDCRQQLHQSMRVIRDAGAGVILYLNQEGRGIGLANKIRAYSLQDEGHDTVDANHRLGLPIDARDYEVAAHILKDLGIDQIRLLTNNPDKEKQLGKFGIKICERIPIEFPHNGINTDYLATKKRRMGHQLVLS
ncbi:MAG: cyclohydrolase-2, partial [Verrucomicrobia bacterium]|nr:cyclohydrolase-2 [Verrucomicrobiota bacterium]